jgi:uncharacterized BrkB/YihY/UPF0761 family membrane protein
MKWLLIAAVLIWLAIYLLMRRAFPPRDWSEQMHLNRIGRRTAIAMLLIVLFSLLYWMMH